MWGSVYTLGRVLLPLLFVIEGVLKFMNVAGIARMLQTANLPVPAQLDAVGVSRFVLLGYLVALIEVVCGLMVMLGYRTRFAALVLALFVIGTIVVGHPFWAMEGQLRAVNLTHALKNLSIIAGLLIIAALGPGRYALDGRRRG
jgi:putative oxidoreductase